MARKTRSSSNVSRTNNFSPTEMTMATLRKLEKRKIRPSKGIEPGNSGSYIHDLTSPFYSWLLPGWLVEERVVPSQRVYKYYYDPAGRQYRAKFEVLHQWEKLGLVVLNENLNLSKSGRINNLWHLNLLSLFKEKFNNLV